MSTPNDSYYSQHPAFRAAQRRLREESNHSDENEIRNRIHRMIQEEDAETSHRHPIQESTKLTQSERKSIAEEAVREYRQKQEAYKKAIQERINLLEKNESQSRAEISGSYDRTFPKGSSMDTVLGNQVNRWSNVYYPQRKGRENLEEEEQWYFDDLFRDFEKEKPIQNEGIKAPQIGRGRFDDFQHITDQTVPNRKRFEDLKYAGDHGDLNFQEPEIPKKPDVLSDLSVSEDEQRSAIEQEHLLPFENYQRFKGITTTNKKNQYAVYDDFRDSSFNSPKTSQTLLDVLEQHSTKDPMGNPRSLPLDPRSAKSKVRGFTYAPDQDKVFTDYEYDSNGLPIHDRKGQYAPMLYPDGSVKFQTGNPTSHALFHEKGHAASNIKDPVSYELRRKEYQKNDPLKAVWGKPEEKYNISEAPYSENTKRREVGDPERVTHRVFPYDLTQANVNTLRTIRDHIGRDIKIPEEHYFRYNSVRLSPYQKSFYLIFRKKKNRGIHKNIPATIS